MMEPNLNPDTTLELGPQQPKDPPFTARMRRHQSWYRAQVLKVPYGVGPRPSNKTPYGNMLTQEDGERGRNFLAPHIFALAKRRLAERSPAVLDRFRLFCNLMDPDAMAFNLFAPLVDSRDLAARLAAALPAAPFAAADDQAARVDAVHLAWAPPQPGRYLNDLTTFNVFLERRLPQGGRAFLAVVLPLAEPLPEKAVIQPTYWTLTHLPDSPWPESSWPDLLDPALLSLWRHHLLVEALLKEEESPWKAGQLLWVIHPEDEPAQAALAAYRRLLRPDQTTFTAASLDQLVAGWQPAVQGTAHAAWLEEFQRRYLRLSESERGATG